MVLIYAFLYAPIVVLIVFSFNEGKTRGSWDNFSLIWYQLLIEDAEILSAVKNTFFVAAVSTVVSTIIGSLGAIGISQHRKSLKNALLAVNQIPVMNPDIVIAVGLMVLYRSLGLDFGLFSLILSHIAFTVPYVVLSVLPKLKQMPQTLPEAAMDLGATPTETLWKVIIPYIKPGIFSGALMAFTLSVDDFVVSFFTTGNGVETISTLIFGAVEPGNLGALLAYTKERVPAFVNTFGPLDEITVSAGAGAIALGFPVIADTEVPEVPDALLSVMDHAETLQTSLDTRGIKIKVTEIDSPVQVASAFEGERIRKDIMKAEFGGNLTKCWELVVTEDLKNIEDHHIEVIGKDIDDPSFEGEDVIRLPLGIKVSVAGKHMQDDFESVLERRIHYFTNYLMG
jgi:ABC-type spermidine/putrescine transport system permease subunit II